LRPPSEGVGTVKEGEETDEGRVASLVLVLVSGDMEGGWKGDGKERGGTSSGSITSTAEGGDVAGAPLVRVDEGGGTRVSSCSSGKMTGEEGEGEGEMTVGVWEGRVFTSSSATSWRPLLPRLRY